VQISVIN